jgi:hypothetical protein
MTSEYLTDLNKIITLHDSISGFHRALEKLQPVAIVRDNQFLIYDVNPEGDGYIFVKQAPTPMPVPEGVRAAFPLPAYDGKAACVVTADVFDSQEGYVTILHEFVHCYQSDTCEQDLKMHLTLARQSQEAGNFMWEIEHPFPYHDPDFVRSYTHFLKALASGRPEAVDSARKQIKACLSPVDFEYLVWQEWKEGFARWVENKLQAQLGLPLNLGGTEQPFNRVLFYAGGAAHIEYLSRQNSDLVDNLPALFETLQR